MEFPSRASRVQLVRIHEATRTWNDRLPLEWLVRAYLVHAVRTGRFKHPDASYRAWLRLARESPGHAEWIEHAEQHYPEDLEEDTHAQIMRDFGWQRGMHAPVSRGSLPMSGTPAQQALALIG